MANNEEFFEGLKSGFGNIAKSAAKVTNSVVSKIENVTKETKLRFAINETEEAIQKNFAAIGSSVYLAYKTETDPEDFTEIYGRIDALNDELEGLKEKLVSECGVAVCPECGEKVRKSSFCPKCGAKIQNE